MEKPWIVSIIIIILFIFIIMVINGVSTSRDLFFEEAKPTHCNSDTVIMTTYCTNPQHLDMCLKTVAGVEGLLRFVTKDTIFSELNKLEPQTTAPFFWAVDQSTEIEDSHLNTNYISTADYFNNNAYFYNVEQNRRSAKCGGGWNFGFWKTLPSNNTNIIRESIQLQYCEEEYSVRVCGAFDLTVIN